MAKKIICSKCKKIVDRDHVCIRNYKMIKPKQRKATYEERENYSEQKKEYDAFYKSIQWQNTRNNFMRENLYICDICKHEAMQVHHKIYITQDFDKRLDTDNLVCLCESCHKAVHKYKIQNKINYEIFRSKYRIFLKERYQK